MNCLSCCFGIGGVEWAIVAHLVALPRLNGFVQVQLHAFYEESTQPMGGIQLLVQPIVQQAFEKALAE